MGEFSVLIEVGELRAALSAMLEMDVLRRLDAQVHELRLEGYAHGSNDAKGGVKTRAYAEGMADAVRQIRAALKEGP